MLIIKTPRQIRGIQASCQLAAQALNYAHTLIQPGIDTQTIDDRVHQFIIDHGAIPAPLNYEGFPKSICTSVNNVVCHGIPSTQQILKSGDIINIDITTILDGYYGDTSATFPVGIISPKASKLIEVAKTSMMKAIESIRPGISINQAIGKVIENYVTQFGFSPVRDLGGHGVGIKFHEDPFIYHFDTRLNSTILQPGMTFTVEPMINASPNWRVKFDHHDGWTVRTDDGSLSSQFEHTVLVTKTGAMILTLP